MTQIDKLVRSAEYEVDKAHHLVIAAEPIAMTLQQRVLSSIIVERDIAVGRELAERLTMNQCGIDRLSKRAFGKCLLLAKPLSEDARPSH